MRINPALTILFICGLMTVSAQQDCKCLNCPVSIVDNGTFSGELSITTSGKNDLSDNPLQQVCFTIVHTWIGDLSATLTSPGGLRYVIMGDNINDGGPCGNDGDDIDICIVTGTGNPLTPNSPYLCNGPGPPCLSGTWNAPCLGVTDPFGAGIATPNCDLNDFNVAGHPVSGVWQLNITDNCFNDIGYLQSWSLHFEDNSELICEEQCSIEQGTFDLPVVQLCQNDGLTILPEFKYTNLSPDRNVFASAYLSVIGGIVVSILEASDLYDLVPGYYQLWGIDYPIGDENVLSEAIGLSIDNLANLLKIQNPGFCSQTTTDFMELKIWEQPIVETGEDVILECGYGDMILMADINHPDSSVMVSWSTTNGSITGPLDSRSINVTEPGEYVIDVISIPAGCAISDTVIVLADPDAIKASVLVVNEVSCTDHFDGQITVNTVEGGIAPLVYSIDGETFFTSNVFDNLGPEDYSITIQDVRGCEWIEQLELKEPEPFQISLGRDLEVEAGDSVLILITANVSIEKYTVELYGGDVKQIDHEAFWVYPSITTSVLVRATSSKGCEVSDALEISVLGGGVYLPNVFSPNDDGVNDHYTIQIDAKTATIESMKIVDRWGRVAHDSSVHGLSWTGMIKNKKASPGVYLVAARIKFANGISQFVQGDVTLIR